MEANQPLSKPDSRTLAPRLAPLVAALLALAPIAALVPPAAASETVVVFEGDVRADGCPVSSPDLPAGTYQITASGDFQYRDNPAHRSDSEYSTTDNWATRFDSDRGLWINGRDPDWGAYRPDHAYTISYESSGGKITFHVKDDSCGSSDNSGSIRVVVRGRSTPPPPPPPDNNPPVIKSVKATPSAPLSHPLTEPLRHDTVTVTVVASDADGDEIAVQVCYSVAGADEECVDAEPGDDEGTYTAELPRACAGEKIAYYATADDGKAKTTSSKRSLTYKGDPTLNKVFCETLGEQHP